MALTWLVFLPSRDVGRFWRNGRSRGIFFDGSRSSKGNWRRDRRCWHAESRPISRPSLFGQATNWRKIVAVADSSQTFPPRPSTRPAGCIRRAKLIRNVSRRLN